LDVIDEESETVKLIFQKYLLLKSQTKLETYLINNDIKTKKGINFSRFALKSILQNPVYAIADKEMYQYFASNKVEVFNEKKDFNGTLGIMAYNKTEQKSNKTTKKRDLSEWIVAIGKHKGLIDGKDWVEVQNILEGNKNKRYRMPGKNKALLSGIIRCLHCGSFMRPKLRTSFYKDDEVRFVYMCELKEKSRKGKCQCKDAPGNEIDEQVIKAIKDVVKPSSNFYQKLKKAINDNFNKIDDENKEINILRNQYHKTEQEISNLIDRMKYVDVSIVSELSSEIVKLKEKNVEIETPIGKSTPSTFDSKEQAKIVLSTIDNFVPNFDNLDILQKRTLIKMLISSVETNGEDVIINFVGSRNIKDSSLVPLCEDTK
jgi:site-specific DNA recombinase